MRGHGTLLTNQELCDLCSLAVEIMCAVRSFSCVSGKSLEHESGCLHVNTDRAGSADQVKREGKGEKERETRSVRTDAHHSHARRDAVHDAPARTRKAGAGEEEDTSWQGYRWIGRLHRETQTRELSSHEPSHPLAHLFSSSAAAPVMACGFRACGVPSRMRAHQFRRD